MKASISINLKDDLSFVGKNKRGKVGGVTYVKRLIPELAMVLALVLAQVLESGWCVKRQTWNVG